MTGIRTWTANDRRIGIWSAAAIVVLSLMYIGTGVVWLLYNMQTARARALEPAEPFLAILEILILLSLTVRRAHF